MGKLRNSTWGEDLKLAVCEVEEGEREEEEEEKDDNLPRCISLVVSRAFSPRGCPEVQKCLLGREVGVGDWEPKS